MSFTTISGIQRPHGGWILKKGEVGNVCGSRRTRHNGGSPVTWKMSGSCPRFRRFIDSRIFETRGAAQISASSNKKLADTRHVLRPLERREVVGASHLQDVSGIYTAGSMMKSYTCLLFHPSIHLSILSVTVS